MDMLSMCRICQVQDVKMYSFISEKLQELYEKLSEMPFETADGRPLQICYICYARLQNCYRLQMQCHQSEEIFAEIIENDMIKHIELQDVNTLNMIHPLLVLSCKPFASKEPDDCNIDDGHWKIYPLEIKSEVQVKDEHFEEDVADQAVDNQNTEEMIEYNDIKIDIDDFTTNGQITEETQLKHNVQPNTVKIVLERIDMKQFDASAPATNKLKLVKENTQSNISNKLETEETIKQNTNDAQRILITPIPTIEENLNVKKKIHIIEKPDIVKNKNIVKQIPIRDSITKKKTVIYKGNIRHTRIHTGEKLHKCDICDRIFSRKIRLKEHTYKHTGEKPFKCDICDKSYIGKSSLIRHIRIHIGEKPHKCEICDKRFSLKHNLITHARIHTGEKFFKCDICDRSFTQKSTLFKHTLLHTGEKPFKCDTCDRSFSLKNYLTNHIHIHSGDKPFKCDTCGRSFSLKNSLVKHVRIHTGEKPYKCDICDKKFSLKCSLVLHTLIHTGEKPFKCEICDKSFRRKIRLTEHTYIHTSGKPFKCDICDRRYSQKSNLIRHTRMAHIHIGEKL